MRNLLIFKATLIPLFILKRLTVSSNPVIPGLLEPFHNYMPKRFVMSRISGALIAIVLAVSSFLKN